MKNKYIDTHSHPLKEYFDNSDEFMKEAHESNVDTIFFVGTNLENSKEVIELSNKYKNSYPIIGIHPNDSTNVDDLNDLFKIMNKDVIAIGEIGLDYHYDDSPSKEMQKLFFEKQIELAIRWEVPVMIHCREADEDVLEILKKWKTNYSQLKIVMHSYSGGTKYLNDFLALGSYLSFSGIVTFKNAKDMQEAALNTPIDRILYETDSPYLTPHPKRGQFPNTSKNVVHVANFLANIKNLTVEEFNIEVRKNAKKMFNKLDASWN